MHMNTHVPSQKKTSQSAIANTHAYTQGGIGAVVAAMGSHIENVKLQEKVCEGLMILAANNPDNQAMIGVQVENIHECI
jgi:hypothetical protein